MKFGKIGVVIVGLVPFNVYGECTPTPDCASIGYTETSCEGDYLACPFDSTKLKCIPCDSSFRYDCSGDNITGGTGSACGGKYASCECIDGAIFSNGNCACDNSCKKIGNIVYSDQSCSSCVDTTKVAVAVVVHSDNNSILISPLTPISMKWASSNSDVTSLLNISSEDLVKEDIDGVSNSQLIREFFASDDETNNAAWYCYNLEVEGFEDKKGQWYLPAVGEIYNYLSENYELINSAFLKLGLGNFKRACWSSSEYSWSYAWLANSGSGDVDRYYKTNSFSVSCFLAL